MGNVVLTGFMGTGKTTVGRLLAERLGYTFVDTDDVITSRHGTIRQIFFEHGEAAFRRFEHEVAAELAGQDGLVISTGGALMLDAANADVLGATGDVFTLTATLPTILERVRASALAGERPMLAGQDERLIEAQTARLLADRSEGYARFTQIATDDRDPADIADQIATLHTAP